MCGQHAARKSEQTVEQRNAGNRRRNRDDHAGGARRKGIVEQPGQRRGGKQRQAAQSRGGHQRRNKSPHLIVAKTQQNARETEDALALPAEQPDKPIKTA